MDVYIHLNLIFLFSIIDWYILQVLEEGMGLFLTTESAGSSTAFITTMLVYAAFMVAIYFLFMRPNRKEQKQKAQVLASLAVGDSVRTTGGFIGTVIDINDDMVIVEFGNNKNCRIPMVKEAIVEVEKPEDAVATAATDSKDSKKK
jgi:preprotein translocase subunit YajC